MKRATCALIWKKNGGRWTSPLRTTKGRWIETMAHDPAPPGNPQKINLKFSEFNQKLLPAPLTFKNNTALAFLKATCPYNPYNLQECKGNSIFRSWVERATIFGQDLKNLDLFCGGCLEILDHRPRPLSTSP